MRILAALTLFLAFSGGGAVSAAPAAQPSGGGEEESVAERLSGIERIMWDRDARSIPFLRERASKDADEKVRERALGALTLLRDTAAPRIYMERLSSDPSPRVRRAAADAIGTLGIPPDKADRLSGPLQKDPDPMVRAECARALGKLGGRAAVGNLIYALAADPSPEVRALAAEALFRIRAEESEGVLATAARQDRSPAVRLHAVRALAEISPVSSRSLFETIWKEGADPDLRLEAYRALLRSRDGNRWAEEGLGDGEVSVRILALRTWFSRITPPASDGRLARNSHEVVRLEGYLRDPARGIREFSRQALEKLGYKTRPDGFAYKIDDR